MNIYCSLSSGRGSWYLRFLQGVSRGKMFRGRRNTPRPQPRSSESLATNMAHGEIETMTYFPVCLASSQWPSPVDSWCTLAHISPLVCQPKLSACDEMPGFSLPLVKPTEVMDRGVLRPVVALQNPNQGLVASFLGCLPTAKVVSCACNSLHLSRMECRLL